MKRFVLASLGLCLCMPACTRDGVDSERSDGDTGSTGGGDGSATGGGSTGGGVGTIDPRSADFLRQVDVLFVIDNSGSMADEQTALARSFQSFIEVLEDPDVNADYRIAVTTTDNGHAACSVTTPEAGQLRAVSCRDRPDEFVWPAANPQVEAFDTACADLCPADLGTGLQVEPTSTTNDPNEVRRPWIERSGGRLNLPDGVSATQAFQCFGPQGVDGCGFEAPLESMYKALQRSSVMDDTAFDFFREQATPVVVIVTDEADCSANERWQSQVFSPALPVADRIFWEDPDNAAPTSSICWNAGVRCQGGPGDYDGCGPIDLDVEGSEVDPPRAADDAVLRPVERYVERIRALEEERRLFVDDFEVIVAVVGGVPVGYETGNVPLIYSSESDPAERRLWGNIAKGCVGMLGGEPQAAIPPVRLREFAESFHEGEGRNLYSICQGDYGAALESVATTIRNRFSPACLDGCATDVDSDNPGLQVDCTIDVVNRDMEVVGELPPCIDQGEVPVGEEFCYLAIGMQDGLTTVNGEASDGLGFDGRCTERGSNLEFRLRKQPRADTSGLSFQASCASAGECPG